MIMVLPGPIWPDAETFRSSARALSFVPETSTAIPKRSSCRFRDLGWHRPRSQQALFVPSDAWTLAPWSQAVAFLWDGRTAPWRSGLHQEASCRCRPPLPQPSFSQVLRAIWQCSWPEGAALTSSSSSQWAPTTAVFPDLPTTWDTAWSLVWLKDTVLLWGSRQCDSAPKPGKSVLTPRAKTGRSSPGTYPLPWSCRLARTSRLGTILPGSWRGSCRKH